jgi:U2-associated protein SR140
VNAGLVSERSGFRTWESRSRSRSRSQSRHHSRSPRREDHRYHSSRRSRSRSWSRSRSPPRRRRRRSHSRSRRYDSSSRSPPHRQRSDSPRRRRRNEEEEAVTDTFIRAVAVEVKGHGTTYENNLRERERDNPKYAFLVHKDVSKHDSFLFDDAQRFLALSTRLLQGTGRK